MLKKFLTLFFPAALILAATTAADAKDMRGRVESVDPSSQTFTLKNGITFQYGEETPADELVPGTSVKVRYKQENGAFVVRKLIDLSSN